VKKKEKAPLLTLTEVMIRFEPDSTTMRYFLPLCFAANVFAVNFGKTF
jgi:hypothetical protein